MSALSLPRNSFIAEATLWRSGELSCAIKDKCSVVNWEGSLNRIHCLSLGQSSSSATLQEPETFKILTIIDSILMITPFGEGVCLVTLSLHTNREHSKHLKLLSKGNIVLLYYGETTAVLRLSQCSSHLTIDHGTLAYTQALVSREFILTKHDAMIPLIFSLWSRLLPKQSCLHVICRLAPQRASVLYWVFHWNLVNTILLILSNTTMRLLQIQWKSICCLKALRFLTGNRIACCVKPLWLHDAINLVILYSYATNLMLSGDKEDRVVTKNEYLLSTELRPKSSGFMLQASYKIYKLSDRVDQK